jgi:hypothetical protein
LWRGRLLGRFAIRSTALAAYRNQSRHPPQESKGVITRVGKWYLDAFTLPNTSRISVLIGQNRAMTALTSEN